MNCDTISASGVFDLDAAPVTITLPDLGKRFMSMQVISEDHDTIEVVYGQGGHTYTKENVGRDVPVDGFWSISVYNSHGYFEKNDLNAYSLNNLTAKPNSDDSFTIPFGGDRFRYAFLKLEEFSGVRGICFDLAFKNCAVQLQISRMRG